MECYCSGMLGAGLFSLSCVNVCAFARVFEADESFGDDDDYDNGLCVYQRTE